MTSLGTSFYKIYRLLGSLRLAVVVLSSLSLTLIVSTFLEASRGTAYVQQNIYQSCLFSILLVFLGTNITASALQRLPWKRRHLGFLLAHVGILTVLFGGLLTRHFGVDGSLTLAPGELGNTLSLNDSFLEVWDTQNQKWIFRKKIDVQPQTLYIDKKPFFQIREAFQNSQVVNSFESSTQESDSPMVHFKIRGITSGIQADGWLVANDPKRSNLTMGLAQIGFAYTQASTMKPPVSGHGKTTRSNFLYILMDPQGTLRYQLKNQSQGISSGFLRLNTPLMTGWRDFEFQIDQAWLHGREITKIQEDPTHRGPGAIRIEDAHHNSRWLFHEEPQSLTLNGITYWIRFGSRQISLPFGLKLKRFELTKYPGSSQARTYSSYIELIDPNLNIRKDHHITMNEPLTHEKFTFYQASFSEGEQGTLSTFSVGWDPGRIYKYLGSILIVFGIITMYLQKFLLTKKPLSTP